MKTKQIKKLLAAGFTELWRDPANGNLYSRQAAWNICLSRCLKVSNSFICMKSKGHDGDHSHMWDSGGSLSWPIDDDEARPMPTAEDYKHAVEGNEKT